MIHEIKRRLLSGLQTQLRLSHRTQRRDSSMDLWEELCRRSCVRSADYVQQKMKEVVFYVEDKQDFQRKSFQSASFDGLFLEFGVHRGASLKLFSELTAKTIHGFDSFEGLPDSWSGHNLDKSFFTAPNMIRLPENTLLHKGWFCDTLPLFLKENKESISFVHVDCDIYSSTQDILSLAGDRIVPGTVILFDEYLNYPSWEEHEYKAFQEFIKSRDDLSYKYTKLCSIGATYSPGSVCVEIIKA